MSIQALLRRARAIGVVFALLQCASFAFAVDATFLVAPERRDIAYDAPRKILYIGNGPTLLRYDVARKSFLPSLELGGTTMGMDISPDGSTLAVADAVRDSTTNRVHFVDLATLAVSQQVFLLNFLEGGTFAVAYDKQGKLLVSSTFEGSGQVPLRKFDPVRREWSVLGSVYGNTMLSPSSDRSVIAVAEGSGFNGFGVYKARDASYHSIYFTGWPNFEIGTSARGGQLAVPTAGGTYFQATGQTIPILGEYPGVGPIGVAYGRDSVYFPWAGTNYVAEYDFDTMTEVRRLPMPGQFSWPGNAAFGVGRTKVASDNSYLFVTVQEGVAVQKLRSRRGAQADD